MKKSIKPKIIMQLLIYIVIVFVLRYLEVKLFTLRGEQVLNGEYTLYHLYFGGLFISNSSNPLLLICELAIFLIEVMLLTGTTITEWFNNLELMLYRTEHRITLLGNLFLNILFKNIIYVFLVTTIFCVVEGVFPGLCIVTGGILYVLKLVMLHLCVLSLYFCLKNELAYSILACIYFAPIILLGFWYDRNTELWKFGKYFVLQRGNWNYTHSIELLNENKEAILNGVFISGVTQLENVIILGSLISVFFIFCIWKLKKYGQQ